MTNLLGILIVLFILIIVIILASVLTLRNSYKYYKKRYKELPNLDFRRLNNLIYGFKSKNDFNECFIWFTKSDDFLLHQGHYIHSAWFTYFDPYSLYWLIKYRKWCKNNIKI